MTKKSAANSPVRSPIDLAAATLEQMLRVQIDLQMQLLACLERKRQGIRSADMKTISGACDDERGITQRIAQVERQRVELISTLRTSKSTEPVTISAIAPHVSEPQRTRLLALAAQLRDTLNEAQRQSSIVRTAAETLSRHMSGIVQTVHAALNRAHVYGSRGRVLVGAPLHSGLDIKS